MTMPEHRSLILADAVSLLRAQLEMVNRAIAALERLERLYDDKERPMEGR